MAEKLVLVTWLDACHSDEDLALQDVADIVPIESQTAGFLLSETETSLTIGSTKCKDNTYRDILSIPKSCVTKTSVLEVN